jgi:gas vesicle protein
MRLRNKAMTSMMLGAGVYLLDALRDRLADGMDDFQSRASEGYDRARDFYDDATDRARDTYGTASRRARRAAAALRGDDSDLIVNTGALLLGVGVGVGVGLLLAPASGRETRRNIAGKVQDLGDKVRSKSREVQAATGTYGE